MHKIFISHQSWEHYFILYLLTVCSYRVDSTRNNQLYMNRKYFFEFFVWLTEQEQRKIWNEILELLEPRTLQR